jgi:hypothetical protein
MSLMSHDHYAVAREIAGKLATEGFPERSQRILNAIAAGSTGTEILMALRWHLREMLRADPGISPETRQRMSELLLQIDASLK